MSNKIQDEFFSEIVAVIDFLKTAHKSGQIEVEFADLLDSLEISKERLGAVRELMMEEGLLDKGESPSAFSLSVRGLRVKLSKNSAGLPQEELTREHATISLDSEESLFAIARKLSGSWAKVVGESILSDEEKLRLCRLGEEIFEHPAFPELLVRVWERSVTVANKK